MIVVVKNPTFDSVGVQDHRLGKDPDQTTLNGAWDFTAVLNSCVNREVYIL